MFSRKPAKSLPDEQVISTESSPYGTVKMIYLTNSDELVCTLNDVAQARQKQHKSMGEAWDKYDALLSD